ncbi:Alpha/Beta hydrolase protein [Xylariomycetidae sp. FL2044]|nr:Alpha/Beta hydrolase protein [Xylariomycetidae sp. FL2044]
MEETTNSNNPYRNLYHPVLRGHSDEETSRVYDQDERYTVKYQRGRRNETTREEALTADLEKLKLFCNENGLTPENQTVTRVKTREKKKFNVDVTIVCPTSKTKVTGGRPCVFFIHGGNRIASNRFTGLGANAKRWADLMDAITVSVEYRRAPDEGILEVPTVDCHDALMWVFGRLGKPECGLLSQGSKDRLVLYGASAGGGLALSTLFYWRGMNEKAESFPVKLAYLEAPQLDDDVSHPSKKLFKEGNMFTSDDAAFGWEQSLAKLYQRPTVLKTIVPSRCKPADLAGFPPICMDVGTAEPFRDEVIDLAEKLQQAEVKHCSLRIFTGGFHGFASAQPDAPISQACLRARDYSILKAITKHSRADAETKHSKADAETELTRRLEICKEKRNKADREFGDLHDNEKKKPDGDTLCKSLDAFWYFSSGDDKGHIPYLRKSMRETDKLLSPK